MKMINTQQVERNGKIIYMKEVMKNCERIVEHLKHNKLYEK